MIERVFKSQAIKSLVVLLGTAFCLSSANAVDTLWSTEKTSQKNEEKLRKTQGKAGQRKARLALDTKDLKFSYF